MLYARWLTRHERVPAGEALLLLAWGGACAAVFARAVNNLFDVEVAVLVAAPAVEESLKVAPLLVALALVGRVRWSPEPSGLVGVVARGVVVAAGFAAVENVFVIAEEYAASGQVLRLAVVRTLLGPLTHPLFTALAALGVAVGWAGWRAGGWLARSLGPPVGLGAAIGVHAAWNLVTTRFPNATTALFVGVAILMAIVLTLLAAVRRGDAGEP